MYCILIAGIPASGKSRAAEFLAERLGLPAISKDCIKERMYDAVGFRSREEKVRLGAASMDILYYVAEQMMKRRQPCCKRLLSGKGSASGTPYPI